MLITKSKSKRISSLSLSLFLYTSIAFTVGLASACKRQETFPDIGMSLSGPIDVAADKTSAYFYVLNSDPMRDYNIGSLLTISSSGEKVAVTTVPRLGRSLTRAGDDLLVTFANNGDDNGAAVRLYDVSNPALPTIVKDFDFDPRCGDPINAVMRDNYKYFAVACSNGMMMVGELKTPRVNSTLTLVRDYPGVHRAMHINTARNLLIAFPTDLDEQTLSDWLTEDSQGWSDDDLGTNTKVPNGIPDSWEADRYTRQSKNRRGIYQYVVYDLAAAAKDGFPYKEGDSVQPELGWVYFNLLNFDGTPDVNINSVDNINNRYYRTNFWQAQPDADDEDTFYLSHRGYTTSTHSGSPHANSIIKVQLTGDITDRSLKTEDVLSFERVYGFKGELDPGGRYYPGSFQIQWVKGQKLLLVNHSRDPVHFQDGYYFSLAAKVLGDNTWFTEKSTTDFSHSYYQVALTPSGRALSVSTFGNVAILLDAFPGADITEIKTIN